MLKWGAEMTTERTVTGYGSTPQLAADWVHHQHWPWCIRNCPSALEGLEHYEEGKHKQNLLTLWLSLFHCICWQNLRFPSKTSINARKKCYHISISTCSLSSYFGLNLVERTKTYGDDLQVVRQRKVSTSKLPWMVLPTNHGVHSSNLPGTHRSSDRDQKI